MQYNIDSMSLGYNDSYNWFLRIQSGYLAEEGVLPALSSMS